MDTVIRFVKKPLKLLLRLLWFVFDFLANGVIRPIHKLFFAVFKGVGDFFASIPRARRENPSSFKRGLSSLFLPGLGQLKNGQWYKGVPILAILVLFLLIEFISGNYIYAPGEIANYPAEENLYFFRDYGGIFTRGIWGFFTLGALVAGDVYRGEPIVTEDARLDWMMADNSRTLMGEGVIVLVFMAFFLAIWAFSVRDAYITHIKLRAGMEIERFKKWIRNVWDDYFAYIIIIPGAALLVLFTLMPFLFSFMVGFTNYDAAISLRANLIEWHGLTTFREVFGAEPGFRDFFITTLGWTTFYAIVSSITVYVMGFIQAMVIESRPIVGKRVWRLILILPWAVPGMVALLVFSNIFDASDGLLNQILSRHDLLDTTRTILRFEFFPFDRFAFFDDIWLVRDRVGDIEWFTHHENANLARLIIILVNLWMGYPYFMLLITGVLGTIPSELYEAADIDGGSANQKFRFITFPWVLRATAPVIITTFTFNFNNFGVIYFFTGGGPAYPRAEVPQALIGIEPGKTDILISWIYTMAFESGDHDTYNLAAVYSIMVFVLIAFVSIYYLSRLRSFWEEDD